MFLNYCPLLISSPLGLLHNTERAQRSPISNQVYLYFTREGFNYNSLVRDIMQEVMGHYCMELGHYTFRYGSLIL